MKEQKKGLFSVMSRIEGMSNQFTKTDWKVVQYIKNNTEDFISCSAQNLAKQIGVSDASIIRFAQKVGFSGLNEFKFMLQNELNKEQTIINQNSYTSLLQEYNLLAETLFKFTKPEYVDMLRERMLKAKRIYIAGMDLNKNTAEIIGHKFTLLGLDVRVIDNYDTLKLFSSLATKEDVFIVLTLSGAHRILARAISKIVENDSFIVLVSNYESSLCSAYADLTFLIPKTNMLANHDTITREIFILMLFDIIFLNILNEDEHSYDVFQETAPFSKFNQQDNE
ncbi:HTH-type transcriptional regulator HexR [Lachnospiraceae bacterium]|nr:HTH-type transcriptional regulator HexR [Lachnospiraceae bacterium]